MSLSFFFLVSSVFSFFPKKKTLMLDKTIKDTKRITFCRFPVELLEIKKGELSKKASFGVSSKYARTQ
jgi:hypothetical protein